MNKGSKIKRIAIRRVRRADAPLTTNQMVAMFAAVLA